MFRHSSAEEANPDLLDWSEAYREKDNIDFFADAFADMRKKKRRGGGQMVIGLLGQRDIPGVTVRRAQSVLRWDLRPSCWSHAFLVAEAVKADPKALAPTSIREVALHSRTGRFPEPADNGVTGARLGAYHDPTIDANVALLCVDMSKGDIDAVSERATTAPNLDRARYDIWSMLGVWESYLWSGAELPNPLRQGFPVPSASFVEYCFEAIQLDVAPGGSERNSSPEHLWNGAKWWAGTFSEWGHPIGGYYVLRDERCTLLDPNEAQSV